MSEGEFVMVLIVEDVEKVAVEGVDVFHLREILEDVQQFLVDGVLAKLDLGEG